MLEKRKLPTIFCCLFHNPWPQPREPEDQSINSCGHRIAKNKLQSCYRGNHPAFRIMTRQHSFTSSLFESCKISRRVGIALYPYISRFVMAYIASATLVAVVAWSFSRSMYLSKLVDKRCIVGSR